MRQHRATAPRADDLLSTADVAEHYGVHTETVRRWLRKGIIGYVMVGPYRAKRIERREADRHFARREGAR